MHPNIYFNEVSKYLTAEGYVYTVFENENVFQKGFSFIKLSFYNNVAVLEAWHMPEMDQTEVQKISYRLQYIEQIIAFFERENVNQNPMAMQGRPTISKHEFFKNYCDKNDKKTINIWCIIIYVLGIINFVSTVIVQRNFLAIVDLVVILGFTLGIHLAYNRGCAIALLVHSCLNILIFIVMYKQLNGYLWLMVSICLLLTVNKMHKDYNNFKNGIV